MKKACGILALEDNKGILHNLINIVLKKKCIINW